MANGKQNTLNRVFLTLTATTLGALIVGPQQQAYAQAVIFNTGNSGTAGVALGINQEGHLNVQDPFGLTTANGGYGAGQFGLASKFPDGSWRDSTSPGCLCEGWGVSGSISSGSYSGYANVYTDGGANNLSVLGFATDAGPGTGSYAISTTQLTGMNLLVEQNYSLSSNSSVFRNRVTITNRTGETVNDLRYVRVMDWDIPFNEFDEYVTIKGTATTTNLEESHNNGFSTANPLGFTSPLSAATLNVDFTDFGPSDQGAYFKFYFGSLAAGASKSFDIFYGATADQASANAAVSSLGLELVSYGQWLGDPTGGTPATYIFGFKGVGGTPVPEPLTMLGSAAALGFGTFFKLKLSKKQS